jgi:predicted AlkP superfamily pyrophosphatase or phosphodiesterase
LTDEVLRDAEEIRYSILRESWLDGFITPDYHKYCISNIPATISKAFNVDIVNGHPFTNQDLKFDLKDIDKILLLVIDSLGYQQLISTMGKDKDFFRKLFPSSTIFPITSTFPSTTPTALSSISSGLTPQQHGITGFNIFLKKIGVVMNMVNFTPSFGSNDNSLEKEGFSPNNFFCKKTLHEILGDEGYNSQVITKKIFEKSALTHMLHKGAAIKTYFDTPDLFVILRRILETKKSKKYIFAYWDNLDTACHAYGPYTEEVDAIIRSIFYSMKTELLDRLDRSKSRKSLLLITSDHGHHSLLPKKTIDINNYPSLMSDLIIPPTGTNRAPYLYPKEGKLESVKKLIRNKFGLGFDILDSKEGLKKELFGFGEITDEVQDRIGDLIILPRSGYSFFYSWKPQRNKHCIRGGHGGLSEDEMLVPFISIPLDPEK